MATCRPNYDQSVVNKIIAQKNEVSAYQEILTGSKIRSFREMLSIPCFRDTRAAKSELIIFSSYVLRGLINENPDFSYIIGYRLSEDVGLDKKVET